MKLDTGALANVISWKTLKKSPNSPHLRPSNVCLKAYGDHIINHKGKVTLTCKANQREDKLDFYVAMTKAPPILGLQAREKLGLIKKTVSPQEQAKRRKACSGCSYYCLLSPHEGRCFGRIP